MLARSVPTALRERVRAKLNEPIKAPPSDGASVAKPRASVWSPAEVKVKRVDTFLSPASGDLRAHSRDNPTGIQQMVSPVSFDVLSLFATGADLPLGEKVLLSSSSRRKPPATAVSAHGDNESDASEDELTQLSTSPMPATRRPAARADFFIGAAGRPSNPLVLALASSAEEDRAIEIEPCRSPSPTALFSAAHRIGFVRPSASRPSNDSDEEIVSFDLADTPSTGSPEQGNDQAPARVASRPCCPVATSLDPFACSLSLDSPGHRCAEPDEGPSPPRLGVAPPVACALAMTGRMGSAPRAGPTHGMQRFLGFTVRSCSRAFGVLTSALFVAFLLLLLFGSDLRPGMGSAGVMHAVAEPRDRRGGARVGLVAVANVMRPSAQPTDKPKGACEP